VRPVPAAARRTALAAAVALLVAGGWWLLRAPAIERPAAAVPPPPDIETAAGRGRIDAAIALASLPDDPWTLAESLAASAPDASDAREKEDCGMADGPQFAKTEATDGEPVLTRAASSNWRASQARIDAALRASADPMDRAVADLLNIGDLRAPEAVQEAVAQQAAVSDDARVVALGYGVCQQDSARASSCASLTAARWAQVDAGNGIPWIDLLAQARARGDEGAQPLLLVARVPVVAGRVRSDLPDHLAHASIPSSAAAGSLVIIRPTEANCPKLEQNRRERTDLLESAALVHAPGGRVVVVDVEAHCG